MSQVTKLIPLSDLTASKKNARKTTSKSAFEDLKASIAAHGLLQNLIVVEAGKSTYEVIAGARRLAALQEIHKDKIAKVEVRCEVVDLARAAELSLAENVVRQAMHPADEFEAYARLVTDGQTIEQIATRFGVTPKHVDQRLQLGRVHPDVMKAYREEKLTLDALMAFTITPDQKKQLTVYKSLKNYERDRPREIRERLTDKMHDANSGAAKFVGLAAYIKAGGKIRKNLFGDEAYIEDGALLQKLFDEKMKVTIDKLKAEGWLWAEYLGDKSYEYTQKMDRIFSPFTKAQKKIAGCVVSFNYNGDLSVNYGYIKKEHKRELLKLQPKSNSSAATSQKDKDSISDSLRSDLEQYRMKAAQCFLLKHHDVAFDLLAFKLVCAESSNNYVYDGYDIHATSHTRDMAKWAADDHLEIARKAAPFDFMKEKTESQRFLKFRELSMQHKTILLALAIGPSLKPALSTSRGGEKEAIETALSLTTEKLQTLWRPTKDNYFNRINREQLLAIGAELAGKSWAESRKNAKKGVLADELHTAFAEPQKLTNEDMREKVKNWLPEGMSFLTATDVVEKKVAKKKKAA